MTITQHPSRRRLPGRAWLWAAIVATQSGCAGVSAYISSEVAPNQEINRRANFYFPVGGKSTIEERKIIELFIEEFRLQNMHVVSDEERALAAYAVSILVDETTSEISGAYPISNTQNTTIKNAYGFPVATAQTQSTSYVPYSESYRVKKIYAYLYSADDVRANMRLLSVWEGYIGVGADKFSKNSRCVIRELVKRVGVEYASHTKIDTSCMENGR